MHTRHDSNEIRIQSSCHFFTGLLLLHPISYEDIVAFSLRFTYVVQYWKLQFYELSINTTLQAVIAHSNMPWAKQHRGPPEMQWQVAKAVRSFTRSITRREHVYACMRPCPR